MSLKNQQFSHGILGAIRNSGVADGRCMTVLALLEVHKNHFISPRQSPLCPAAAGVWGRRCGGSRSPGRRAGAATPWCGRRRGRCSPSATAATGGWATATPTPGWSPRPCPRSAHAPPRVAGPQARPRIPHCASSLELHCPSVLIQPQGIARWAMVVSAVCQHLDLVRYNLMRLTIDRFVVWAQPNPWMPSGEYHGAFNFSFGVRTNIFVGIKEYRRER